MRFEFGGEVVFRPSCPEDAEKTKTQCSQCMHRASLCFSRRSEKAGQDLGRLLPFRGGFLQLAMTGFGKLVKFCLAVVIRKAPARADEAFLFELEQRVP
jgi:hypothetical protein